MPLNIFETRYLAMVDHALGNGRLIGMIRPKEEDGEHPCLYDVGCAGRITDFSESGDGRYLITLTGVSRFVVRSEELVRGGFRLADVDWSRFTDDVLAEGSPQQESPAIRERILELLMVYLKEVGLSADWESIEGASAETIINSVAMSCPFDPDEKQALLEAPDLLDRAQTLITLMEMAVAANGRRDLPDDLGGKLN